MITDCHPEGRGFTLIEVMLALGISAIVLAAIGGVFFSAVRLRERTSASLDEAAPLSHAFAILRRDFEGAIPPGSPLPLAGDFKAEALGSGNGGQAGRIQLFTTTGLINDQAPWGDIQRILYDLREPAVRSRNSSGRDLIRTVTRNLLSTATEQPDEQLLLGNVQSLEFLCYDGSSWRNSWDTTLGDTNLPLAIKIRIQVASGQSPDLRNIQPFELVVPILSQSHTNGASSGGGQ